MTREEETHHDPMDDFWRDLTAQLIATEEMPREEADRRMEIEAEPLPEPEIEKIVAKVTAGGGGGRSQASPRTAKPSRQPMGILRRIAGFRYANHAAAAGTMTAILLIAGLSMETWQRNPTYDLGFQHATEILTDSITERGDRTRAMVRVFGSIQTSIETIQDVANAGGTLGEEADEALVFLRSATAAPRELEFRHGAVDRLEDIAAVLGDSGASEEDRRRALNLLTGQILCGVGCIYTAADVEPHQAFRIQSSKSLELIGSMLAQ